MLSYLLLAALANPAAPGGIPPSQMLASIDNAGQLRLLHVGPSPCDTPAAEHLVPGPAAPGQNKAPEPVAVKITTLVVTTAELAAKHATAYTVEGRPIAPERLATLLTKERPVLVSCDGKKVDPFHLQLYREDTIVLVLPMNALPMGSMPVGVHAVPEGGLPFPGPNVMPAPAPIAQPAPIPEPELRRKP